MGLMSLLCCSSNTVEDNDKYINKSATATIPPKNEPKVINNHNHNHNHGKKRKDKKDDFDDNSVNETETIANTNEEPTPTTNGQNDSSIETTQEGSSSKQPTNTNTGDEVIIAQQNSNEDIIDLDLQDLDEESLMDLTKFQEGQYRNPETGWLLGKQLPQFKNKKCLILDLDETLVHSSFKYLRTADFVIPVEIDNQVHHVYVIKRPGVDEFLQKVGQWYEVVVFTASVQKYGDPLLNKLDIHQSIHHRLFRDSCYNYEGNFIKNLSQIGRPLSESIIIDNSPASYIFHPQHSVPISSWFSDTHDNELLDLLPFLEDLSKQNVDDVSLVLDLML